MCRQQLLQRTELHAEAWVQSELLPSRAVRRGHLCRWGMLRRHVIGRQITTAERSSGLTGVPSIAAIGGNCSRTFKDVARFIKIAAQQGEFAEGVKRH